MNWTRKVIGLSLAALSLTMAHAQGFNCDLNNPFSPPEGGGGAPSAAFGAAAGQIGYWNALFTGGLPTQPLRDLNGNLSTATITGPNGGSGGGHNIPGLFGDYRALMADATGINLSKSYTLSGLANGSYRVYVYAVKISGGTSDVFVTVPEAVTANPQVVTGPMPVNTFAHGVTHSIHLANVISGNLTIRLDATMPSDFNGFQIVAVPPPSEVAPIGYQVMNGLNFGGTLASLLNSDNDRVSVLCDSDDSLGEIHFFSDLPQGSLTELRFKFEARATRTDLSQFVDMYNYASGQFSNVHFRVTTLFDTVVEGSITNGVADFVDPVGEVKSRVLWIPNQDLLAFDGWTQSVDQVQWTMLH